VDIGLILAAATPEPGIAAWLGLKILAGVGVAAGLTFVIFVHELGHFLVAKACGVKCEKFYVGFDFFEFGIPFTKWKLPRALAKVQWGETEYGIGSLPLGGYVKMLGQDDDPRNAEQETERIRAASPAEKTNEAVATSTTVDPQHPEAAPVPAKTTEGSTILLDPRSYPAKPVPARMAIISAGVIMNLIFAVILAAVAYRLGVDEVPAVVGSTTPGGAAWVEAIEPGSKIVQIGKGERPYHDLRWDDIRKTAMLNSGHDVPMLVQRPDGDERWYDIKPVKIPGSNFSMVGIGGPQKPEIKIFADDLAHLNPQASSVLKDHDRVVSAGGHDVKSGADLAAIFAQQPLAAMPLTIERRETPADGKRDDKAVKHETLDVTVQAKPMRELGLAMKIGPIVAIQKDSPAQKADFQVGDVIVEVNGESVGDPLSLSQRLTPKAGETSSYTFVVERKDRQGQAARKTISLTPRLPLQSPTQMPINPTSIESIGVAFEVTNEVADVADNGPAAAIGLSPGDMVTEVQLVCDDPGQRKRIERFMSKDALDPVKLKPGAGSWPQVVAALQLMYPDMKIKLTWTRDGKSMSGVAAPRDSATFFNDDRGIALYPDFFDHVAKNWPDAFTLGYRKAREELTLVVTILHRLITGRVPITSISGPGGIIAEAAKVASAGVVPLLLFLTMLSANLAVINFLPIPALDGGHMLFLSAEAIRGKPVDERLQVKLTIAGVICLLSLMVFATAMDVQRWFG